MLDTFHDEKERLRAAMGRRETLWLEGLQRELENLEVQDPDWTNLTSRSDSLRRILPMFTDSGSSQPAPWKQAEIALLFSASEVRRLVDQKNRVRAARTADD